MQEQCADLMSLEAHAHSKHRNTETFIRQRLMEVSPKLTEINFFVGFGLIFIGFWLKSVTSVGQGG
jgi:hypothetical protein